MLLQLLKTLEKTLLETDAHGFRRRSLTHQAGSQDHPYLNRKYSPSVTTHSEYKVMACFLIKSEHWVSKWWGVWEGFLVCLYMESSAPAYALGNDSNAKDIRHCSSPFPLPFPHVPPCAKWSSAQKASLRSTNAYEKGCVCWWAGVGTWDLEMGISKPCKNVLSTLSLPLHLWNLSSLILHYLSLLFEKISYSNIYRLMKPMLWNYQMLSFCPTASDFYIMK